MTDERELLAQIFTHCKVSKQQLDQGVRYVGRFDGQWDLLYEHDPYAKQSTSVLSMELGLLPFAEGKHLKALRQALNWNHYCLNRHGFGLVFSENGHRVRLQRKVPSNSCHEVDAKKNLTLFLNCGKQAAQVIKQANQPMPNQVQLI